MSSRTGLMAAGSSLAPVLRVSPLAGRRGSGMAGRLPCPRDRVLPPPLLPSCVLKPAVKNVEQRHVAQTRVGGVSVCDVPKWVRNSRVGGRRQLTRSSRLGRREPARGGGVAGGSGGARSLPSPAQRAAGARGGKDAATGLRRALLGDRPRNKMADDKEREGTELAVAEFHKKIKEAFEVFDHESNNTVDMREIGTIIRSLGCYPTEGELHDLIAEIEEEEPTGYIRYEKFLPVMTKILQERRYRPIPEDILLRAFEVLDQSKCGFLTKEELIKYMTEEGEPFSQEEMEEMLSAAIDPESNSVHYKDYITMMVIDDN
ncbi:dynein regulatory complex protein 8 [Manis javanica]|uniref:dynein regulatory complex protein 8 n=1 Tax=Manis javanica TaxID=9974 RepID=UPI003C6CF01F